MSPEPFSDEALMQRVRSGSTSDLGALFDRYSPALFNFFRRLGHDATFSEDLVQEVFLRILKYSRTYRPGKPFRTWMYQIARNARIDSFRGHRDETVLDEAPVAVSLPRDDLQAAQEIALLERALLQLPDEKREVLVLSRYQDMKYEQIADILDCEVSTVKVKVHRALRELRENFRRLERAPGA